MKFFLFLTLLCFTAACTQDKKSSKNEQYNIQALKSATISPSASFGDVAYNEVKIITVRITNSGDEILPGPASLSSGSDFSIAYQSGCSNLAVGGSCTIKLSLDARTKSSGIKNSNLIIFAGGLEESAVAFPVTANILAQPTGVSSGGSTAESISISAAVLDFGTLTQKSSVIKTVTIKNTSSVVLNKAVSVPAPFTKAYDTCSGKNISPGASCSVKISLVGSSTPGGAVLNLSLSYGSLTPQTQLLATIQSDSESIGASQLLSDIDAYYNNQEFSGSLAPANLGILEQGKSYIHTFYLKNNGSGAATISSVTSSSPQFTIAYNSCSGLSLQPTKSCMIKTSVSPVSQTTAALVINLGFETRTMPLSYTFQPVINCAVDADPCEVALMDGLELKTYKRIFTKQQLLNILETDSVTGFKDLNHNVILEADIDMVPAVSGQNSLTERSYLARYIKGHFQGNNKKILNWKGYSFVYGIFANAKVTNLTIKNAQVSEDLTLVDTTENRWADYSINEGYCVPAGSSACFYWPNDGYYIGALASLNYGIVDNVTVMDSIVAQPSEDFEGFGDADTGGIIGWNSQIIDNVWDYNVLAPGGEIKNSTVVNTTVSGYANVGGVVGWSDGKEVRNVTVTGGSVSVDAGGTVGGVVGASYSGTSIKNVTNSAIVSSNSASPAGGIIGKIVPYGDGASLIEFDNLTNNAPVTSQGIAGGIIGYVQLYVPVSLLNFINHGEITSPSSAGGVLGNLQEVTTSGSYPVNSIFSFLENTGVVNGSILTGGVIGYLYSDRSHILSNLHNSGDVLATGNENGGLIAKIQTAAGAAVELKDSTNEGNVEGGGYTGGIVGTLNYASLTNLLNSGNVTAVGSTHRNYLGGIVGATEGAIFNDLTNEGNISGASYIGGIVGLIHSGQVNNSISTGNISGAAVGTDALGVYVGGIAGHVNGKNQAAIGFNGGNVSGIVTGINGVGGVFGYLDEYSTNYIIGMSSSAAVVKTGAGNFGGSFAGLILDDNGGAQVGRSSLGDVNSFTLINTTLNIPNWGVLNLNSNSATGTFNGILPGNPGYKYIGDWGYGDIAP